MGCTRTVLNGKRLEWKAGQRLEGRAGSPAGSQRSGFDSRSHQPHVQWEGTASQERLAGITTN